MNDLMPAQKMDQELANAIEKTTTSPALARLHHELVQGRERLRQPMRVAIVGLIKAGKSTTMNALLGEENVVATGPIEATFNVNWLCYGEQKSLEVHFKDGRPVEVRSFEELERLTRRGDKDKELLHAIKYIKVYFPNELFRTLELIDTPGLWSVHGADSANARAFLNTHDTEDDSEKTQRFLEAYGNELTKTTLAEASQADAVLYLFRNSVSTSAADMLKEFQGPMVGNATPINSIGVLTKLDAYWPGEADPRGGATRVVKRLQSEPQVQRLFYAIMPLSGLLALGAQTLTRQEFEHLKVLAAIPEKTLRQRLRSALHFTREVIEDLHLTPDERSQLYRRLGQYGIWRACQHLNTKNCDQADLQALLLEDSGLPELRKMIMSHFGKRAFLIKLDSVRRSIEATTFSLRSTVSEPQDREILKNVSYAFEKIASDQEEIAELRVLRAYYEDKLALKPAEVQQLLQITGEQGQEYWQRLGIQEETNISTLERLEYAQNIAKLALRHWRQRLLDPGLDRETRKAALVLSRSYERMLHRLREALQILTYTL